MSNNRTGDKFYQQTTVNQQQFQYGQYPVQGFAESDQSNSQNPRFRNHHPRHNGGNIRYPQFNNAPAAVGQPQTNAPGPWSHPNMPSSYPHQLYPHGAVQVQINPNATMQSIPSNFPSYYVQQPGYVHPVQPHPAYPHAFIQQLPQMAIPQYSSPYHPPTSAVASSGTPVSMPNQSSNAQAGIRHQANLPSQTIHNSIGSQNVPPTQQHQFHGPSQPPPTSLATSQATPFQPPQAVSQGKSSRAIPIVDPKTNQEVTIKAAAASTPTSSSQRPSSRDGASPKAPGLQSAGVGASSLPDKASDETSSTQSSKSSGSKASSHPAHDKQSVEKEMMMQVRNVTKTSSTAASSVPTLSATSASAKPAVPSTDSASELQSPPSFNTIDSEVEQPSNAHTIPSETKPVDVASVSTELVPPEAADEQPSEETTEPIDISDTAVSSGNIPDDSCHELSHPVENGVVSTVEEIDVLSPSLPVITSSDVNVKAPTYDFKPDKADSDKMTREKKLKYDRQFLYSLQESRLSTLRPVELPKDMPDILVRSSDSVDGKFGGNVSKNNTFMPSYVQSISGPQGHKDKGSRTPVFRPQNSRKCAPAAKPMVIEIRKEKIDLHKSEDAYVPAFLKLGTENEDAKNEEIERHIRSVLNKITPQNFDSCFTQLTQCDIGSVHGLQACVDIIFEKATREVSYSSVFAEICKRLQFLKVNVVDESSDDENKKYVGYRSLLLKKCQNMFETPLKEQMEKRSQFWDEKINAEETEDKKRFLQDEKEEAMKKVKDQFYGNIRFVGELFIKDILTANIIHKCIFDLLKADANMITESLECLCELLRTVGKKIEEEPTAKERIDQYFSRIQKLIESKQLESKVRFKLIDIVEMRTRKWELREMVLRLQEKPMTKEELSKKEKMEEEKKKLLVASQQGQQRGGRGYQNKPPVPSGGPVQVGSGEWQHVTASKSRSQKVDAKKLVIGSSGGGGEIRLGPGRNRYMAPNVGRQDNGRPSTPTRISGSSKNSRESSTSRGTSRDASPHPDTHKMPRSASSQELPSRAMVDDSSRHISKDLLQRKSRNVLDEWLASLSTADEAKQSFSEIANHPDIRYFVEVSVDHILNESNRDLRERGGKLFYELMATQLLKPQDFVEGFSIFIENAEDMLVDIPHLFVYFGELFSQLIQKENHFLMSVKDLVMKLDPALKSGRARAEILSKTLHLASARIGHDKVGEAFRSSQIQWEDMIPPSEVEGFIQSNDLEFTVKELLMSPSPIPLEILVTKIQELCSLSDSKEPEAITESIFSLIEKEVNKAVTEESGFCDVLVRSICGSCISKGKFDKCLFKNLSPVFERYVENLNQEMWCIKAVVDTVIASGLSSDMLSDIFMAFLDAGLISEDAFENWRSDEKRPEVIDASDSFLKTLDCTKVHDS